MKVSFFVHDLAANPIVRAQPLIRAVQALGHDVEVLGFLISGDEVFSPYRDFHQYKVLRSTGTVYDILGKVGKMAQMATGEIIYSCKPVLTAFLPALLASGWGCKRPLLLDVEDNDVWGPAGSDSFGGWLNKYIRGFKSANSAKYGVLLHPFVKCCSKITVSSAALHEIYGGTIIRHGPDESLFDPCLDKLNAQIVRKNLGLPPDPKLVLFAGVPQKHKGFDLVVETLESMGEEVHLMLCGNPDHADFRNAKKRLRNRCHLLGFIPNERMPEVLAAADIVPILQKNSRYTRAQLPAKLLEAMAMGKIIIASSVGDLPEILGKVIDEPRGWIVSAEPDADFAAILRIILDTDPAEVQRRCIAARQYFLKEASVTANASKLEASQILPKA